MAGPDPHHRPEIREMGRQFSDATILMHEAIARKAGLSGTDHKYLGILMQHGAMTAGEFAQLTGLTTGAATGMIDRLEKKQLLRRETDPGDRRKTLIVPEQENAMRLLGSTFSALQTRTAGLMRSFSEEEVRIIDRYLRSAIAMMQDFTRQLNSSTDPQP